MENAVNFITQYFDGFLATTIDDKPRIRPFHFMYFSDRKFYFCTSVKKEVYKELRRNPFVEFCSKNDKMSWIRLRGEIQFTNDRSVKENIIQVSDIVKDVYKSADNQDLISFYIEHGEILFAKDLFNSQHLNF
jgi:uncharacterized pyridoxamine 5'-phosphate oxidase family protein